MSMTDTAEEHDPCTDDAEHEAYEDVDGALILVEFPSELLVYLAETLGNPLALLVSKAHLSKGFCRAAHNAQGLLTKVNLCRWPRKVDDKVVAAVISKCSQLTTLNMSGCFNVTNAAVLVVASECKQLSSLNLNCCRNVTELALVAVASECTQLKTLNLGGRFNHITNSAVVAVASECKQLTTLYLENCSIITDTAVVAVDSSGMRLTSLSLHGCRSITDAAVKAVASGCKQLTTLRLGGCEKITGVAVESGGLGVQAAHDTRPEWLLLDHRRDRGGSGQLGLQTAHVAEPEELRHHHQRGDGGLGLGVQATQVAEPGAGRSTFQTLDLPRPFGQ